MSNTAIEPTFVAFLGQSNMVGFNQTLFTAVQNGWSLDPLTYIWNPSASQFEIMFPGVNLKSWGPELGFALAFRVAHPDTPLFIVKTAAGETSLAQNLNERADWNPASENEMFDLAVARIDAASEALGKRPDATFISQGETDGYFEAAAHSYGDNFNAWLIAIRNEIMHDEEGYVVWSRIADTTPNWEYVRWYQYVVDRDTTNTDSFDTYDASLYSRQGDNLHLDSQGLLNVGERFFRLFEDHFLI